MWTNMFRDLSIGLMGLILSASQPTPAAVPQAVVKQPVESTLAAPVYVAGYSITTRNADEGGPNGKIGKLWGRFLQENLGAKIPNRIDQSLIAVYSDYTSDEHGEYTYLLGAPVSSVKGLPEGMTYRTLTAGPYAVFTTDKGPVAKVVQAKWMEIWATSSGQLGGKRAFSTDYEIYDQRSADPNNSQVEIHIGIKLK